MMDLELLWSAAYWVVRNGFLLWAIGFVLGGILFIGFSILAEVEKRLQPGKESTLWLKLLQLNERVARYQLGVAIGNMERYNNLDFRKNLLESDEIDYLLDEESSNA
jgi:hypothetical protein